MRPGLLRTPLEVQQYTETQDALHQPVKNWVFLCKAWGKLLHQNQTQYWTAAQQQSEGTIVIETRYITALIDALNDNLEEVRLKSGNRIFQVKDYFDPDERFKRLHILVKEQK